MRERGRPRGKRLIVTLAALLSLIVGYYLGQQWQRQPLADLNATVFPNGIDIHYPDDVRRPEGFNDADAWRLFMPFDSRVRACEERLQQGLLAINRLASQPELQSRTRLTLLLYDDTAREHLRSDQDRIEILTGTARDLDTILGRTGTLPLPSNWCADDAGGLALVSPDHEAWAMLPWESPASMAHSIATLIEFLE